MNCAALPYPGARVPPRARLFDEQRLADVNPARPLAWLTRADARSMPAMEPARLEAFTDGVVAIIITIMVLELRVPHGSSLASLREDVPVLLAYVLSYVNVGIFWNNHHHMLQVTERVDGRVLWANLGLLFWLSLVPFVIRWIDESGFTAFPTAAYGVVLLCAGISYNILQRQIIRVNGRDSRLAVALGADLKGKLSIVLYAAGIGIAFVLPWLSIALYVAVAVLWLVPDKRIESLAKG